MLIQSAQQQNSSINAGFDQSRLFLVPYSDICIDESLIVTAFASTRLMAAIPFITSPGNYSCRMSSYTVSSVFEFGDTHRASAGNAPAHGENHRFAERENGSTSLLPLAELAHPPLSIAGQLARSESRVPAPAAQLIVL